VKVCKGGDKYKVILKVSKKLWTKSEFTKHKVIDDKNTYREDTTNRKPFEEPKNPQKNRNGVFLNFHLIILFNLYIYFFKLQLILRKSYMVRKFEISDVWKYTNLIEKKTE